MTEFINHNQQIPLAQHRSTDLHYAYATRTQGGVVSSWHKGGKAYDAAPNDTLDPGAAWKLNTGLRGLSNDSVSTPNDIAELVLLVPLEGEITKTQQIVEPVGEPRRIKEKIDDPTGARSIFGRPKQVIREYTEQPTRTRDITVTEHVPYYLHDIDQVPDDTSSGPAFGVFYLAAYNKRSGHTQLHTSHNSERKPDSWPAYSYDGRPGGQALAGPVLNEQAARTLFNGLRGSGSIDASRDLLRHTEYLARGKIKGGILLPSTFSPEGLSSDAKVELMGKSMAFVALGSVEVLSEVDFSSEEVRKVPIL